MKSFDEIIADRRSIRHFDSSRKVTKEVIEQLLTAAIEAPSWKNKQTSRYQVVTSQNGNMYREGLGKKWEAREAYWKNPTPELRKEFSAAYAPVTIIGQYTGGTQPGAVSPDGYNLDIYYSMTKPDYAEIQNDLILDYRTNVALYPEFQKYLRDNQPPLLAVWGKNDSSFISAGAEAFKRDLPNADVRFVDSGHFAFETHAH